MIKIALLALLLGSCSSVSHQYGCLESLDKLTPCRPNRVGVLKFNEKLDQEKPLGAKESGGWVRVEDLIVGSADKDWLRGFYIGTQKVKWWVPLGSEVASPLAVFGKDVVLGLRSGEVIKVDGLTGKLIWKKKLGRFVARRPVKVDDRLYLATVDQKLFALNYQTGDTVWVYSAALPTGIVLDRASEPVSLGEMVFFGTAQGTIEGISRGTGKQIWSFDPGPSKSSFADIVGELAVVDGNLVASRYDGTVFSLKVATGKRLANWTRSLPPVTSSAYRGGVYYVGCLDGSLYAIDVTQGKELWKTSLGQPVSSITPGEKFVYVAGTEGGIAAISSKDAQILWRDDVGGHLSPNPVLFDDVLYFSSGLKTLYGYKVL